MADTNETTEAGAEETTGNETEQTTQPASTEQKPHRPTLSDEEQLAVLEGRAQRLRTKLGKGTPEQTQPSDDLTQKTFLRAAGIKEADEVELALTTAKKWGMTIDKIVDDEDFVGKLTKLRTQKANDIAASGRGAPGTGGAAQSADFYIARGTPPTREEVPDRKTRVEIVRAMGASAKGGGKQFYNS